MSNSANEFVGKFESMISILEEGFFLTGVGRNERADRGGGGWSTFKQGRGES